MIRYFQTFLTAAEAGSFSAAAARLALTQSAVSTQIRRLEEDLDCRLFERTGKSVVLSEAGHRLLPEARRLVELYAAMKDRAGPHADAAPVELGAVSTVQSTLLAEAMRHFRERFPDSHVNVVPGMSTQLLTQVDARELDVAVLIRPRLGLPPELKWVPLVRERFVGIAPAGAPRELRALVEALPFIRYNRHSTGGQLVDQYLKRQRLWVREGMELDEPAVILQMVAAGLGCAIIPAELVPLREAAGVVQVPLPGGPLYREVGVLVRESALRRAPVAALIDAFVAASARRQLTETHEG